MAQRNFYDDEDDSFWSRIFKPADEDEATATPPPPPPPAENFNVQTYAAALIKRPIAALTSDFVEVPDLRTAANKAELTRSSQPQKGSTPSGTARPPRGEVETDDGAIVPAQQRNDTLQSPPPEIVRRPPATEEEREERERAIEKEEFERIQVLGRGNWKERFDLLVEIAKREGFLPRPFRHHLWGQFRDRHVSIEERLDAAHAISELRRLFPDEAEQFFGKAELQWIQEIVRLDDDGVTDPERIIDEAARNIGFIDISGILAGAALARRRRFAKQNDDETLKRLRRNIRNGSRIQRQVSARVRKDLHELGLIVDGPKRVETKHGTTFPDLNIGTKSDQIWRLYTCHTAMHWGTASL